MKVLKPTVLTDAMLVSSTVTEDDHAAYSAGTTYAEGVRVIRTSTHRIYESLQSSNIGNTPETSPLWWVDVAPTNRWAMFDGEINTKTSATTSIEIEIQPGLVTGLALLELDNATSVTVEMRDGDDQVVFSQSTDLDGSLVNDWYTYFFEPFSLRTDFVITNLPAYGEGVITVTISGSGTVSCGYCLIGETINLGTTGYGAQSGIIDYSKKDTDEFGVTTFVRRHYSRRMSAPITMPNGRLPYLHRTIAGLRATPCLWVGSEEESFSPLIVYGYYRDFAVEITYPTESLCTLEIEGLI